MKKVTTFLASLLVVAGAYAGTSTTTVRNGVTLLGVDREAVAKEFSPSGYTLDATKAPPAVKKASRSRRAPALASLKGYYYTTDYGTSVPLAVSRKYMVQIAPLGTDSVTIYNLIGGQRTVKGAYDASTGVIKIKPQATYVDSKYGSLYCCVVDLNKKAYYTDREIELTVGDGGNIEIGSWGIFVLSGQYRGTQIVNSKSKLYKANAMITDYSLTQTEDSLKVRTYPACYSRESKTQIAVRNFYNCGSEVVMTVDSTGAVFMPHQTLATQGTTDYYNYCISSYTSPTNLTLKSSGLNGTYTGTTISFGMWAFSRGSNKNYVVEALEKSVISVPEEFTPFSSALTLKGAGTKESPYEVATAQDLENLANANNHNENYRSGSSVFTGVYFRQTADIDMKEVDNHEPIGIARIAFNGNYDGQGHTISNLAQNRRNEFNAGMFGLLGKDAQVRNIKFVAPTVNSAKSKVGIVAGESNGKVSNITVTGGYVGVPAYYSGGIVGMNYGTVDSTSFSGTIEGENMVGGIVGVNYNVVSNSWSDATVNLTYKKGYAGGVCGSNSRVTSQISDSYFTGIVTDAYGEGKIGGIAGYMYLGTIDRCWNGGQVNASYASAHKGYAGGIIGHSLGAKLNNCYNSGIVRSYTSDLVGGIAGVLEKGESGPNKSDAPELNSCLNTGVVLCAGSALNNELYGSMIGSQPAKINDTYFDGQASFNGSTEHALETATLASGKAPEGFDAQTWTLKAGLYPQLAKFANVGKAMLDAVPFTLKSGETVKHMKSDFTVSTANGVTWSLFKGGALGTTGHGLKLSGNNVTVTATTAASDTLTVTRGNDFRIYILKVVPDEFEGAGTEANPYLIKTKDDLMKIRNAVDLQLYDYTGTYFKLANDIDMGGNSGFFGMSVHGAYYAFNGTLDGNGHSIKNWQANRSIGSNGDFIANTENYMAGLFIYTGLKSVIKNLNIASDCQVTGGSYVAGVAAYNSGRIENCRNFATVKATKTAAAGVAAYNAAGATVTGCYNAGTITSGGTVAGGIVGTNLGAIELSQNDGNVGVAVLTSLESDSTSLKTAGGIAGENGGTMANVANLGHVSAGGEVGGIAGNNAYKTTVTGLIAAGTVESFSDQKTLGAVFGKHNTSSAVVTDGYYDSQLAGKNAGNAQAVDGITASTTASLVSGDTIKGIATAHWSYAKGQYPVLKAFASEPASAFNRANYIEFASEGKKDTRFLVHKSAQIATGAGAKAALASAKSFTISGSTLNLAAITEVARDTLTFTSGTLTKAYPLFAAPKMLPKGDGTKDNPWRIETVADWQTVAKYSLDYEAALDGEYLLLVNDLDFKGDTTASAMLVADGATRFQGHFDGNGKTIDGFAYHNEDYKTGINKGLFGLVGDNGVIENLTLGANSDINGYQYIGGFAGLSSGTMRNCVNRGKVTTSKMGFAGGLAGVANPKARFINCKNYGTVTSANGQGGGIAGEAAENVAIDSCFNAGAVSGKYSIGGITGSSNGGITLSTNEGAVTASQNYAGGITGYQSSTSGGNVTYCVNRGKVTTTTYSAGGIIGCLFRPGIAKRNVNHGDVQCGTYGAGGIIGTMGTTPSIVVDSCVNYGSVVSKASQAGGIVGVTGNAKADNHNVISHNVNYGSVECTKQSAGGIVGENKMNNDVVANINYASVTADYQAGGIVGNNNDALIKDCFNAGGVQGRYNLGGVAGNSAGQIKSSGNAGLVWSTGSNAANAYNVGGVMGTGKAEVSDVYNHGNVHGCKQVGGIIGLPVKNYTTLARAFNTCNVACASEDDSASCGNVCGGKAVANVTVTDTYYDSQAVNSTFANDTAAKAVPTAALTQLNWGDSCWTMRANCYPAVKTLADSAIVKLYSAALAIAPGDKRDAVTESFNVGVPEGVEWTVSDNLRIDEDGHITLVNINGGETATLKASIGGNSLEYTITLLKPSGAEQIDADKEVERMEYVGVNGMVYSHPVEGVNIVRTIYKDGTSSTRKMIITRTR